MYLEGSLVCLFASKNSSRDRVDDLLVIWEKDGRLRLARPKRDDVLDVAVLETGLAGSFTPPSLADGRIFVRNLEQVAAVRIVAD